MNPEIQNLINQHITNGILTINIAIILFSLAITIAFYYKNNKKKIFAKLAWFWGSMSIGFFFFGVFDFLAQKQGLVFFKYIAIIPQRIICYYLASLAAQTLQIKRRNFNELTHLIIALSICIIFHFVFNFHKFFVALVACTYAVIPLIDILIKGYKIKNKSSSDHILLFIILMEALHFWDYSIAIQWSQILHNPGVIMACCLTIFLAIVLPYRVLEFSEKQYNKDLELKIEQNTKEITTLHESLSRKTRLENIGSLASGITHELNSPLAAIVSSVTLIEKKLKSNSPLNNTDLQKVIKMIMNSLHKATEITGYLKKISTLKPEQTIQPVDLNALIPKLILKLGPKLNEKKIQVQINNNANGLALGIDNFIEEILTSLISNSIEVLSEQNNPMIQIDIIENLGNIEIKICDNGPGIPEEIGAKVLEPFFTTKEIGKNAGVGLSSAQIMALQLGGTLELTNLRPTTFEIKLKKAE